MAWATLGDMYNVVHSVPFAAQIMILSTCKLVSIWWWTWWSACMVALDICVCVSVCVCKCIRPLNIPKRLTSLSTTMFRSCWEPKYAQAMIGQICFKSFDLCFSDFSAVWSKLCNSTKYQSHVTYFWNVFYVKIRVRDPGVTLSVRGSAYFDVFRTPDFNSYNNRMRWSQR